MHNPITNISLLIEPRNHCQLSHTYFRTPLASSVGMAMIKAMTDKTFKVIDGGRDQFSDEVIKYFLSHPIAPENKTLINRLQPAGYEKIYLISNEGKIIDPVYLKRKNHHKLLEED